MVHKLANDERSPDLDVDGCPVFEVDIAVPLNDSDEDYEDEVETDVAENGNYLTPDADAVEDSESDVDDVNEDSDSDNEFLPSEDEDELPSEDEDENKKMKLLQVTMKVLMETVETMMNVQQVTMKLLIKK